MALKSNLELKASPTDNTKMNRILFLLKNLLVLSKPRITLISTLMAIVGASIVSDISTTVLLWTFIAVALDVASANVLNMYIERNSDGQMERTSNRPLPSKKLSPNIALLYGVVLGILSIYIFYTKLNMLSAILGLFALFMYVCIYTPLKQKTVLSMFIGVIPGAMPPLLGNTSATNTVTIEGILLFVFLMIWQIPHFLAISLVRKSEYQSANIKVITVVMDDKKIWTMISITSILTVVLGVCLYFCKELNLIYLLSSISFGIWFLYHTWTGMNEYMDKKITQKFYFKTISYLSFLILAIVIDIVY